MNASEHQHRDRAPAKPAAPPTLPGELEPIRSGWHAAIGSIAISFASLGLLLMVPPIVGALWVPTLRPPSYRHESALGWVFKGVFVATTLWHLAAGILVSRRSRLGPPLLLGWASAATLIGLLVVLSFVITSWNEPGYAGFLFGGFFGIILLTWPVYLLFFLNRPIRKAEWKSWG